MKKNNLPQIPLYLESPRNKRKSSVEETEYVNKGKKRTSSKTNMSNQCISHHFLIIF